MDKKIAFLGCGNMASAMIGGILESKMISAQNIMVTARTETTLKKLKKASAYRRLWITLRRQPLRILFFYQ